MYLSSSVDRLISSLCLQWEYSLLRPQVYVGVSYEPPHQAQLAISLDPYEGLRIKEVSGKCF
jgi:hypothetical protein